MYLGTLKGRRKMLLIIGKKKERKKKVLDETRCPVVGPIRRPRGRSRDTKKIFVRVYKTENKGLVRVVDLTSVRFFQSGPLTQEELRTDPVNRSL